MFRDELDALNAIHQHLQRLNALLEKALPVLKEQGEEDASDATKGRGGRNRGKGS